MMATDLQRGVLAKLDAFHYVFCTPAETDILTIIKETDEAFGKASIKDRYNVSKICCEFLDEWEKYPGEFEHLEIWLPYCEDGLTFRKKHGSITWYEMDRDGYAVVTICGVGTKTVPPKVALNMKWAYKAQLRHFSEMNNLYAIEKILEYSGKGTKRKAYVLWRDYGVNHASWEPATSVAQ